MIREAVLEDIPHLARIAAAGYPERESGEGKEFWGEKDFSETLENPQAKIYVFCEEEPAGFVILYFAADEAEIPQIAVDPAFRRRGVAASLLSHIKENAPDLGIRKLFLEVRESNTPARRLYQSHGFLHLGERKNFYENPREDACILCLTYAY